MARERTGKWLGVPYDWRRPTRARVRERWSRLPDVHREEARDWLLSRLGNYRTITDSARLILHGGALALSLYVLGYLGWAGLDMAGSFYRPEVRAGYLFLGAASVLGPHPQAFWDWARPVLVFASHLVVEPLRVCLIASTVAYCAEHVRRKDATAAAAP